MEQSLYTVKLLDIIDEFKLETVVSCDVSETLVLAKDINRPGIQFSGYYEYYDKCRIQIIGNTEQSYLDAQNSDTRNEICEKYLKTKPVAVVFARGITPCDEFLKFATMYSVPVYKTDDITSVFMAALISYLNVTLAERTTVHGVLVEIYGEGVLLLGNSGVGKSETAIELVKRGHRLIADDAVEIKRISTKSLLGTAPELIRHFIELRGIGIVDVRQIFGIGAVKVTQTIDLIINLEPWEDGKHYDRLGIDSQHTSILDVDIPSLVVPVKPGRNLAVILEVAAVNNRHKNMGFNAALDLSKRMEEAYRI